MIELAAEQPGDHEAGDQPEGAGDRDPGRIDHRSEAGLPVA
jgi:hypothetical protein